MFVLSLLAAILVGGSAYAQQPDTLTITVRADSTGDVLEGATAALFHGEELLGSGSTSRTGEARLAFSFATAVEYPERPGPSLLGRAYPSPFVGNTTVPLDVNRGGTVTAQVFDLLGREVVSTQQYAPTGGYELKVDLSGLPASHYFVVARQDESYLGTASLVMLASESGTPKLDLQPANGSSIAYTRPAARRVAAEMQSTPGRGYWLRVSRDGYATEDFAILLPEHRHFEARLSQGEGDRVNSIGMEFVRIPAGTFRMGDIAGEGLPPERPVHEVSFTRDLYVSRHEVTQALWVSIMVGNPSRFKECGDCPVDNVSWEHAQIFVKRLNEREGTKAYRLPTEAEWEYAARAGTETRWSFGDAESMIGDYAWHRGNSGDKTHPVGQKKPNPWGLYDMHGNVSEMVLDWFDRFYYISSPTADPQACTGEGRGYRGGTWRDSAWSMRSAFRYPGWPSSTGFIGGVRLVKEVNGDVRARRPFAPDHPVPADGTESVSTLTTLAWSAVDRNCGALTYDVYFGTTANPPQIRSNQSDVFYERPLAEGTTYYWKVVARDEDGNATEGPLWSFTTTDPESISDTYTNSIDMDFVRIPAGSFLMGDVTGVGLGDAVPVHEVTISSDFYIGRYEVTQRQWEAVMGSNPSRFAGEDTYPLNNASWAEVQEFIDKLNHREGTLAYRLPTEAEWEYAARAATKTTWSFGNDESRLTEYAWWIANSSDMNPVGQKKPNPWGLYDVHGNVAEWVHDWYSDDYYAGSPMVDPQGPDTGTRRVYRGGGLEYYLDDLQSARRYYEYPDERTVFTGYIGFRLLWAVQ